MDIFFLLVSLAILVLLVFRNVPIFFSAVIASAVCAITAQVFTGGGSFLDSMFGTSGATYVSGLSGYFGNFFWLFILGALFGKLFEVSGAAESIANGIVKLAGEKAIVPAIVIAGFALTYGGVSVFVCLFALYPLILSMCQRANISRTMIPLLYFAGAGTGSGWFPGSPQIQNTVPADILGVSYSAALVPGAIAGIIEMVMVFAWVFYCIKRSRAKGMVFEMSEKDKETLEKGGDRKFPPPLLAFVPMIILLVALNFTPIGAPASLAVGLFSAMACFYAFIDWKDIWNTLRIGLTGGMNSLFSTASVVGFGTVVQGTPAFANIIDQLTTFSGNPVVTSVIAVAIMSGVCGSGSGGQGIAMPIIKEHFVPNMTPIQIEGLARASALSALTLDSLPHNGLVVSVIDYTSNTHKNSYPQTCVVFVIIPLITMGILLALYGMMGYL